MSGKATLFGFKFLSSYPKFFPLIFLVFLFLGQSIDLSAQVIIKERVSIYPNSLSPITPDGLISGDPNNPVYLRYGGNVVLRLTWPYSQVTNWHDTRLGEETLGEIARNLIQGDSVMIGPFPQWQKLQFWVTDSLRLPDMEREKVYPSNSSSEIIDVGNYGETVDFQLPKVNPADTIVTEMSWSIKVKKNDNLAAMPPPEILSYYGNPFVPSEEIEIPADGMVYMILENLSSTAMVDLYLETPSNQLLLTDLLHQFGQVIDLGRKNAGDLLRFYITSSHSIVAGQNLYPKTIDDAFFLYWDRSIRFKNLYFEDWTDLLFDNFYFALYIVPDHLGDFPWPMQVQFSPAVLAPGDTADIVLRKRNENGSLETFPDSTLFDVQILDSFQYGTIYSPDSEDTSDFFFGIPQGFQFIARDSLNNDSAFVPVIVNTSGGIITATPLINPGMGNKIKDQRLKKKEEMRSRIVRADEQQRNRKTLPFSEERSHIEVVNTGSNVNPVIEGIESGDYSMGIGEVLVISELVNINILFSDSVLSPLINADNKNNPNYNANGPDKRKKIIDSTKLRKTNLTVYITDVNNNPIENYSFTIKALVRPKSGGHNHNNNRPIGKFITPEKDTISVYNGKTDTSGQAQYIYLCSGFGGVDSIFVQGKTEKDTSSAILTIKIKELQLLADGDHYNLVGETTTHPINHYGTSNLNSILITLADTAYADSTYILQYNDMNLINGGPFDINSNWDTPHQTHREGSNVDMRTWSADQEGRVLDKRYIKKLVRKFHGKLLDEGNHFHLTF